MEKPKLTAKDFFLYIGALATLYWSAGSLLALLFRIIDTVLTDRLDYYVDPYSSGIRFAVASLIVVFPISLLLFRAIKKDVIKTPEKLLLPLRRWLLAGTIFVTAIALVGDVIALLNGFLGGELTTRFALKVLSVFVVAGLVFWYSLLELKMNPALPAKVRKEFLWGTPLLVLAAIVYGFFVMGSPASIRALRFDERRVGDLQGIQWQVVNFWQLKGVLPQTLAALEDPIAGYTVPTDPETSSAYTYSVTKPLSFKLCAVFGTDVKDSNGTRYPKSMTPYGEGLENQNWSHAAGEQCFDRTIDPELYPPVKR
ncbi:MAG: hypothetical protein A2849_00885 [Candidatus Taylorbacteria bacterium RIFCSPHIGHO2_01_FULL_51_15]|uniref:DUF5671 domain-containing protein n=1 Tax=Candidatus Taylorbacteria bacterium RIFCSPHIGHO2_01_FULL_51_15 TaxID=1802304 RepID=A0A1G2MB57_9BACT|nr:MAG: hypothetical protein A2849_00885 [Candidatus Taylorbacteria bacterium RIFCSPHIGHO2_01_FULL_51_15]